MSARLPQFNVWAMFLAGMLWLLSATVDLLRFAVWAGPILALVAFVGWMVADKAAAR